MRTAILALLLLALALLARAERCEMVGGCAGNVWYLHVPKSQLHAQTVFRATGIPQVNATIALAQDASLLFGDTFIRPPYPQELKRDLEAAVKKGEPLTGWGSILRAGSRVRIMSYTTFPQLEAVGDELFALVLVLSDEGPNSSSIGRPSAAAELRR
jgi:hypothetical protein